jgi:hypothetical protein
MKRSSKRESMAKGSRSSVGQGPVLTMGFLAPAVATAAVAMAASMAAPAARAAKVLLFIRSPCCID